MENEKTTQLGNMNKTTQQEKNNSTQQQERTTQLCSRNETTQPALPRPPATAYNNLQPPTTACTAFTAESAFSTY
ncbi:hypothetical protein TNCV_2367281 [Trichonephila clavipes]|nr:hypothetical protein TNCV_2367281 [Trichonephila clavipes]